MNDINFEDELNSIEADIEKLKNGLINDEDQRGYLWIFVDILFILKRVVQIIHTRERERK